MNTNKTACDAAFLMSGNLLLLQKSKMEANKELVIGLIVVIIALAGVVIWLLLKRKQTPTNTTTLSATPVNTASREMQLQAYERLTLLTDRIALHNLIVRVNQPGLSARDMQTLLHLSIKEEFDYNITQQVYVSADTWTAVKQLKDQTLLIINQVASQLPSEASGNDLNRILLEFLMNDNKGKLHELVAEIISSEAKKVLA